MSENFEAKITPMINSSKILLKTSDSALNSFNLFIRQGWGDETRKSFASINNKFKSAATASGKGNQAVQRFQETVTSLDSATAHPESHNRSMNKSLADADKQTRDASRNSFGKNITELKNSIGKFASSVERIKRNKMISDTTSYLSAARSVDSLNQSVQNYMKDPPPLIKIGGGGKKK